MERSPGLLLNEQLCSQLGGQQRAQFVFEWLTHLKKRLPAADRVRTRGHVTRKGVSLTDANVTDSSRLTSNRISTAFSNNCPVF